MNVTVSIPHEFIPEPLLSDKAQLKKWVITEALTGVGEGLLPMDVAAGKKEKLTIYLPNKARATLLGALPAGVPPSQYIAGLVSARGAQQQVKSTQKIQDAPAKLAVSFYRPEQKKLIDSIEKELRQQQIIMSEAGTGIGKTIAALTVAARQANHARSPVVYTVPTITVLSQALRDYQRLQQAGAEVMGLAQNGLPPLRFLIGRMAFVSPTRLAGLLEQADEWAIDMDTRLAAQAWIDNGGPYSSGAKTEPLHHMEPALRWLADDLRHCAPSFPVEAVTLSPTDTDTEDCPAYAAYSDLRDLDGLTGPAIVVCTHTMLGLHSQMVEWSPEEVDNQLQVLMERKAHLEGKPYLKPQEKKALTSIQHRIVSLTDHQQEQQQEGTSESPVRHRLLPPFRTLLVDEAHQLENVIANLMTASFNPRMLSYELDDLLVDMKGSKTALAGLKRELGSLHRQLQQFGQHHAKRMGGRRRIPLVNQASEQGGELSFAGAVDSEQLRKLKDTMQTLSKKQKAVANRLWEPLRLVTRMIDALAGRPGDTVWISYSPNLSFPSLQSGPNSVRRLMERIWNRVDNAVLMSATMMLPDNLGIYKPSRNLISALSVPLGRLVALPPLSQSWLYTPTLHHVGNEAKARLMTLLEADSANTLGEWCDVIAGELYQVVATAKGGTLVLLTSYERITHIAKALVRHDKSLKPRLVVQSQRHGIRTAQAEFERKAKEGLHPIWLATGPAWTGLDLQDASRPAEEDVLLTDLVIAKLPFGTNHSSVHNNRASYNFQAEVDRAALEFKQGLGRLVRRAGLQDRRIHLLDPRINSSSPHYTVFRMLLRPYYKD